MTSHMYMHFAHFYEKINAEIFNIMEQTVEIL